MIRLMSAIGVGVLSTFLLAGATAPEASPTKSASDLGPIILEYNAETSALPISSAFLLPGKTLEMEVLGEASGAFTLDAPAGRVDRRSDRAWSWVAPEKPGLYRLEIRSADASRSTVLNAFVMVPALDLRNGSLNGYRIGEYPDRALKNLSIYEKPQGFVEVTPGLEKALVSPHFELGQFLCKQEGGFPKYVVLRERLVHKLEHLLGTVNQLGFTADSFHVMSGFRTPSYNEAIGNVPFSRHVFGGAADIFIDADGDGVMDDLNRDGRVDASDAQVLYDIVDREDRRRLPLFAGGLGRYSANAAHGPFVHVDVRGTTARW